MNNSSSTRVPLEAVMYMLYHIFLPPNLPQQDDFNPQHETFLLNTIDDALQKFKAATEESLQHIIECVIVMVENLRRVREDSGAISEQTLKSALGELANIGGVIPLHIKAQNAGIIISQTSDNILFEAFELSPLNESVITTTGRLRRCFPGCAFAVSRSIFNEEGFQTALAQAVAKMSHQSAPDMQPKVRKAKKHHNEDRDTTHPSLVTEYLMSFVRAAGKPVEVSAIWKNTRDEVMWLDSLRPWRRSPLWLLIRVALQLGFSRSVIPKNSPDEVYKAFMAFLLAHILQLAHRSDFPTDMLFAMNAKLSRRLLKLGSVGENRWGKIVYRVMSKTHALVESKWKELIDRDCLNLDLVYLKSLNFKDDTTIHLSDLDDYVATMARRESNKSASNFAPTSALPSYACNDLPSNLGDYPGDYQSFNLASFESWVDLHLESWLSRHINDSMSCGRLRDLIEKYHAYATSHYVGNPESASVMLLTVMELWVACDKSASALYTFFSDYSPEVPIELLQSMILPFKNQMERLSKVEQYIRSRKRKAKMNNPSIFRDFGHQDSFSVRYFNQSLEHQNMLHRIEDWASHEREEKCRELRQKKEQYRNLMQRYDQTECEYYEIIDNKFDGFLETRHSSRCNRCRWKREAASISIHINEWPLPDNELKRKSAIFELMIPEGFREWRDATIFLLADVLECEYSNQDRPRARCSLHDYQGLPSFARSHPCSQRIILLSQVKPHITTHRRIKSIVDTMEDDVCLNNGLQYQYFDSGKEMFTSPLRMTDSVLELCTYRLPSPARLLSLASSLNIQKKCLKYLEKAREAVYGWVNLLLDKAQNSTDDVQRKEFLSRSVEISLICASTFDVDRSHLDSILASPSQSLILIRCFITIQEYAQSTPEQCDSLQYIMFERRKNLSYRVLPILTREIVETRSPCLNDAIRQSWSDYEAGGRWERSESPYEHWLYGKTAPRNGLGPLSVHFNLLTAELLVNGLPLARLPSKYENHPTYNKLFGRSALKVMPTEVPGMEFSAEKSYSGYTVHFNMQSIGGRSDLLVHATRDGQKYDFLPSWIFEGKFPAAFVNGFAHWYDHASNAIEFRPIEKPWSSSCANWWLRKVNLSWRLAKDDIALIGMLNNTALALGNILSSLEESLNIHVFFQESSKSLNIELPRLQLGFYLEVGTSLIKSLQFRGMSIAQHQGIGTLIGLRNKLVLRQDNEGHTIVW
ncbi:hypothetical protein ACMFMG_011809 [Clarireedia jacksonii]